MMLKSLAVVFGAALLIGPCDLATGLRGRIVTGTWGGDNAGLMADDTSAHVHIGCTNGNTSQGIEPDAQGFFDVNGSYLLRAYPVAVGPTLPAHFVGTVRGGVMQLTVVVNDTTGDSTATLGPVQLRFGKEPRMGPCPICRNPKDRM